LKRHGGGKRRRDFPVPVQAPQQSGAALPALCLRTARSLLDPCLSWGAWNGEGTAVTGCGALPGGPGGCHRAQYPASKAGTAAAGGDGSGYAFSTKTKTEFLAWPYG